MITKYAPSLKASIVDIGGGASRLVDALAGCGYRQLTVLDLSEAALEAAQQRLGVRATQVQWIVADATKWQPVKPFDLWHDRAAFHFLVDAGAGIRYYVWGHVFVRPEVHYYHIMNNSDFFSSGNIFRVGASIGYTIGPD